MKYVSPKTLILPVIVLLAFLVPSIAWSQPNTVNSGLGNPNQAVETEETHVPAPAQNSPPKLETSPQTTDSLKPGMEQKTAAKAWDLKSILTMVLLPLTFVSSLFCLYRLYFHPAPQTLDHGRIIELVRASIDDSLIRKKELIDLVKQLPKPLETASSKDPVDIVAKLGESITNLQTGFVELKQLLVDALKEKTEDLEKTLPPDLTAVLERLGKLEKIQADIWAHLNKPQLKVQQDLPVSMPPVETVRDETPEEKTQNTIKVIDEKFENWSQTASTQSFFHEELELGDDKVIAFAPKRNSRWSDYRIPGNIKADDFFDVKYEADSMRGIITKVECPAIIIKSNYGQIDTRQKGRLVVTN